MAAAPEDTKVLAILEYWYRLKKIRIAQGVIIHHFNLDDSHTWARDMQAILEWKKSSGRKILFGNRLGINADKELIKNSFWIEHDIATREYSMADIFDDIGLDIAEALVYSMTVLTDRFGW